MNNSYVFYESYYMALQALPDKSRLRIYDAINAYALRGVEPEFTGTEYAIFELIRPQIDANRKRREGGKSGAEYGKMGGRPRKNPIEENAETPQTYKEDINKNPIGVISENPIKTPNVNVNVNANVNGESNNARMRARRSPDSFIPPTREEVKVYCAEECPTVDADRFFDYYSAIGWRIGANQMYDWKACVRRWGNGGKDVSEAVKQRNAALDALVVRFSDDDDALPTEGL